MTFVSPETFTDEEYATLGRELHTGYSSLQSHAENLREESRRYRRYGFLSNIIANIVGSMVALSLHEHTVFIGNKPAQLVSLVGGVVLSGWFFNQGWELRDDAKAAEAAAREIAESQRLLDRQTDQPMAPWAYEETRGSGYSDRHTRFVEVSTEPQDAIPEGF